MQNLLFSSFSPLFYSILGGLISVFFLYTFAILFYFIFVHSRARSLIGGTILSHYVWFVISFFLSSKIYELYLLFCMMAGVFGIAV